MKGQRIGTGPRLWRSCVFNGSGPRGLSAYPITVIITPWRLRASAQAPYFPKCSIRRDPVIVPPGACAPARKRGSGAPVAAACNATTTRAYRRLEPYFDLACVLLRTPCKSNTPRTSRYFTPGKSLTRPPRTSTTECSCKLCLSPGMWAITSVKFVKRILATLRNAEFGFLGVVV